MKKNISDLIILIVDDTPANIDLLKGLLSDTYLLQAAVNGKQALKIIDKKKPDLILLDIMMPEMDGYEVCKLLKADEGTRDIPIIFLTAKAEVEDETKGLELGAVDYITKPISPAILRERVNTQLKLKSSYDLLFKQQFEIQQAHKQIRESIEYASLIQSALIPDNKIFKKYYKDYFAIWHPKDIVGGDIYLAEELSEDEIILMVIDCTGHAVPGAFVTMLVKAIERQVTSNLYKDNLKSPAKILSIFNQNIKHLLKQEDIDSISNAGFDGGILYYNKKEKVVRFAGAETPLFVIQNDELKTIKGNRHSVGYKKSDINYEFTDHTIDVSQATQLYLTTDGYLDQNGGEKSFPFGKKRFTKLIQDNMNETFADQQELLLNELHKYQQSEERNDDVTVIGLKI